MPLVVHLRVAGLGEPGAAGEERARGGLRLDRVDLALDGAAGRAAQAPLQVFGQVAEARVREAQAPELGEPFGHGPEAGAGGRLAAQEPPEAARRSAPRGVS